MATKPTTLRWLIIAGSIIAAIIICVQLYWLQKIYRYEQKLFNINVTKSIKGLYQTVPLVNEGTFDATEFIRNPRIDQFIAKIDSIPSFTLLSETLTKEFSDFDIYTDCKLGVYDTKINDIVQEGYIDIPDASYITKRDVEIPFYRADYNYLTLYFPNRNSYVLKQMYFWIFSGIGLIVALISSAFSIFYLYRQRFLNEIQKEFVNNFTHEFKTPLAVLKIAAGVIQQPDISLKPQKLKNYANIIDEQIIHLQAQTQRLLQIAYTEQARLPLKKEKINIELVIRKAQDDLQPLVEEKNARITVENLTTDSVIYADEAYMLLTFVNLLENALKNAPHPIIRIKIERDEKHFYIGIMDNGPGIEKKHQKKIFDKFYRVTSGELHASKGFGLGLNFVKKVLLAHKATIKVISDFGKGALFLIKIPIK